MQIIGIKLSFHDKIYVIGIKHSVFNMFIILSITFGLAFGNISKLLYK